MSEPATVGGRVYEVRKALGPHTRKPMPQDAFAQLLTRRGKRRYYGPEVSLWEQDKKGLTPDDIEVIAAVDPKRRGKLWLGWGEAEADRKLTAEEITRARAAVAAEDAVAKTTTTPAKKRNHR